MIPWWWYFDGYTTRERQPATFPYIRKLIYMS